MTFFFFLFFWVVGSCKVQFILMSYFTRLCTLASVVLNIIATIFNCLVHASNGLQGFYSFEGSCSYVCIMGYFSQKSLQHPLGSS